MHGLPPEHDGPVESWAELVEHVRNIAKSDLPIRLLVGSDYKGTYFEARGRLRNHHSSEGEKHYAPNTVDSRESGGFLSLVEADFVSGHLSTLDGDDYFTLRCEAKNAVFSLRDTNSI